jgi:peptidoglycan/LPS O-acetylase OafA/YrhL
MVVIAERIMLEVATAAGTPPSVEVAAGKREWRDAPSYRPDIDGLRAVAVLSVVIYHLNKLWMPGGYVGVDIFFVISGFLITRNIWGEMEGGRFSFSNFYLRRIRRIAPAFLAMTAVTLAAGAFLLLPEDLLSLAKSAMWGVFSLSNVYFWRYLDTSYFAESADEVPMLHTWSLGVEEQFYFIWPSLLLMALLFRRRRAAAIAIAATICIASFVCGELTNVAAQKFSYYMLPARAGELMVGALLALGTKRIAAGSSSPRALAEVFAIAGMALVVGSLYLLNDTSRFPGINALYPCLGAAMLMMAGGMGSRIVAIVLTPRPIVFIGLISYSLYLWHWPVLAFVRYFYGTVDGARAWTAVIAMLGLAVASYRYVEVPTRHWRAGRMKQVLALYAAPSLLLCAAAGAIWWSGGLKAIIESSQAYREGLARVERHTAPAYKFSYNCQLSAHDPEILKASRCILPVDASAPAGEPSVLLWGDSQAAHYLGVLGQVAAAQGFRFRNTTHSSCPPVFGGDYGIAPYKAGCDKFRPYMESAILSGAYRTVAISGAWNVYDGNPNFRSDLERTIGLIAGRGIHVLLIGQAPIFMGYNRECELRGLRIGGVSCRQRLAMPDPGDSAVNRYLAGLATRVDNVSYLDIRGIVCRNGTCNPYLDDIPAYFDASHMSMDGSWRIGSKLLASPDRTRWLAAFRSNSPSLTPSVTRDAQPPASPGGFSPRALPLILGGYRPGFPYHVRSQQGLDSTSGPAGAVLEFWGVRQDEVLASVERDMTALGFREVARGSSGEAIRVDFQKPGLPKVSVNVGPLGTLQPQAPRVAGIVYLRW